jgi:hypothetical protein
MRRSLKRAYTAVIQCRVVPVLLVAVVSIVWAASVCSAKEGRIEVSGFVYPVMELLINESLIEWNRLEYGENVCPVRPTYTVLSNVAFRVTIESPNPYMRVTDAGPMQGSVLKNPLEWSVGESDDFVGLETEPATVVTGEISFHDTLRSLAFAQKIDLWDQPSIDSTQCYRTEVILSLEPAE